MNLDCLRSDKTTLGALRDLFIESITKLAANDHDIDFKSVYDEIVKNRDIEIDVESAAHLYEDIKNDSRITGLNNNIAAFMTTADSLDKMIGGEVGSLLAKIGKTVNKDGTIKFQKVSSPRSIAIALMNVLNNKMFSTAMKSESVRIKEAVYNYAKSILGVEKTGKTVDILAEALDRSMKGADFTGTTDELFAAIKPILADISSKISDPATRLRFEHEIKKINEAAFNLGITESKRKKILYDALKNSEFGKDAKKGNKTIRVVDWNKLAREENMASALKSVLSKKLDDLGYKGDKSKVYDALINDINNIKKATAYQKALANNAFRDVMGREVAMYNGFHDIKDGRKFVNYTKDNPVGRQHVMEMLKELGYDPATAKSMSERPNLESVFDIIGQSWSKLKTVPTVKDAVRRLMVLNNKPWKHRVNEMDRLLSLHNKGLGMDATTDALTANIIGVRVKPSHIEEMNKIVKEYAEIMKDPQAIYDEIAKDHPGLKFDYKGNIPLGLWASRSLERLNRRMSDLMIASISDGSKLVAMLEALTKMQRTYLASLLFNPWNTLQNTGTAINTMAVSGRSVMGEKKWRSFIGHVLLDAQGSLTDPNVLHREFKDWSEAETFAEKVGALYRTYTQGVLSAIDGVAYIYGQRRSFYNGIRQALKEKGLTVAEIDKLLNPYLDDMAMAKSTALAEYFFKKAGITPEKIGKARYARELEAEAMNIQMSLMMSGDMSKYISPEHIVARKESTSRLTRFDLGKEIPYVWAKGKGGQKIKDYKSNIPYFGNWVSAMGQAASVKYNAALKAYSDKHSFPNKMNLIMAYFAKMALHGGPFAFGAGIAVFADKAIGTVNVLSRIDALTKGYKKKYTDVIKETNDDQAANVEDTMRLMEEYEIYRRKNFLFLSAIATSLIILGVTRAVGGGDDDDDTNIFDEAVNDMYKLGEGNPATKAFLTRVAGLPIRMAYALKNIGRTQDKSKAYTQLVTTVFNTGPADMRQALGNFIDARRGGDIGLKTGDIGKMLSNIIVPSPVAAISGVPLSFYNAFEDAQRGYRLKSDPNRSQVNMQQDVIPPIQSHFINGMMIGQTGQQLNYFMQGHASIDADIMVNDKLRNPQEYDKLKGERFSTINWADYGSPKLNDGKYGVDIAYAKLDDIRDELLRIGTQYNVQGFNDIQTINAAFHRPFSSMFLVDAKKIDLSKYPGIKASETGQVNIAALAAYKLGIKLSTSNIENAIKYRNFQESLR